MQMVRLKNFDAAIVALVDSANRDGHQHVRRLVRDFESGKNRFQQPGEALFAAYGDDDAPIGIGGLNIDPYEEDERVGRVRRLFVVPEARRQGVGRRLMAAIEEHAWRHFHRVQLYTESSEADSFYTALGFQRVRGRYKVSHEKRFDGGRRPLHAENEIAVTSCDECTSQRSLGWKPRIIRNTRKI